MTKITFLPHEKICPEGAVIEADVGESICEAAVRHGIKIEHACDMACACTTCHVIVRKGGESLNEPLEIEEDMLDKAWGLEADSRLSCQSIVADTELVVEIPKYTINHAAEKH